MTISSQSLVEVLRPLAERTPGGVFAFDADGTLWSGDVGEDVFHEAVGRALLREEARPALAREASAYGLEASGSPNQLAQRLYDAHLTGGYPERSAYAMMAWCYAGFSLSELLSLTREAFERTRLAQRLHPELVPIFELARATGVRIVIVSASPRPVVCEAVRLWQLDADAVIGARPGLQGDRISDHLVGVVPYAEGKPEALRDFAPKSELLASFGDSVFDLELLHAAQVGVAVRPKPALRARLAELTGISVLEG